MSVAIAPTGSDLDLGAEIRQTQSALLYADSVNLISPRAALIQSIADLEDVSDLQMLELMVGVAPVYAPQQHQMLESLLQGARSLPSRTARERQDRGQRLAQLFDEMRPAVAQLQDRMSNTLEGIRYRELALAMEGGLLTIDRLPNADVRVVEDEPDDSMPTRYFDRVKRTLTGQDTYPLFDAVTNNLVRLGVEEGIFTPTSSARRRGRDAALTNGLFDRLPNLENAEMAEVLDIRTELREPLHRFRQGVRQITDDIDTAPEDPQFEHQVQDAWITTVSPALSEIEERIAENSSLREKFQRFVYDPATLTATVAGSGIAIAAGPAFAIPSAVSLLLGGLAGLPGFGVAALRTDLAERAEHREITKAQFYFLYGANDALG